MKGVAAKREPVAGFQAQPVGQNRVHHRAGKPALRREGLGRGHRRGQLQRPGQRIGIVDGFDLRQRAFRRLPLTPHGHGPEIHDRGDAGGGPVHEGAFRVRRIAVGKGHLRIPAQKDRALILQRALDPAPHRTDGGNRGDTKREAGEEDGKAPHPPAQLAPGKADGDRNPHSPTPAWVAALCSSPAMAPS